MKYKSPILLRQDTRCGYKSVVLSNNGISKHYTVHELVYFNFNKTEIDKTKVIDHIDGNKLNNCLNNLRYISIKDNLNASLYFQNNNDNRCKKIICTKDEQSQIFSSIAEASRILGIDNSGISKACKGKLKTVHGYKFNYIE